MKNYFFSVLFPFVSLISTATPNDSIAVAKRLKYIQSNIHSVQINVATPILKGSTFIYDNNFIAESAINNDGMQFNFLYQYNVNKNYFLETFITHHSTQTRVMFSSYVTKSPGVFAIEESKQNFWNIGLGGGYRLISENHKRLLDINFGLNFIYAPNTIGNNTLELNQSYLRDKTIEIKYKQQELKNFLFGFYIGASKEFRLHKGLHLQVSYQHRYLRNFLSIDEIEYNIVDENLSGKVKAYNTLDRSFLMLGLKYYLAK